MISYLTGMFSSVEDRILNSNSKLLKYCLGIVKKSLTTLKMLFKIMIPIIILIKILQELNVLVYLSYPFMPLMELVGLPHVYALALVAGVVSFPVSAFYLVLVLFETSPLTYAQMTTMALMISTCHALILETAIASQLKVNPWIIASSRFISALFLGIVVNFIFTKFGIMQDIVNNAILSESVTVHLTIVDNIIAGTLGQNIFIWLGDLLIWLVSQIKLILFITALVTSIFFMVDILKRIKVIELTELLFSPFCKALKIETKNTYIVVITYIIGLSYAWGILKEKSDEDGFTRDQALKIVLFTSLVHAIVEDTLLFVALGANGWALVLIRTIYAFLYVYLFTVFILPKIPEKKQEKYVYNKK